MLEKLLEAQPARLALIAGGAVVALAVGVLVSVGVLDLQTFWTVLVGLGGVGGAADRFNQSTRGPWAPRSVEGAIVASHAHSNDHLDPEDQEQGA